MQDRNFDDIADKFARNIYGTTKGRIRQAVLWQDLETLLATLPQRPLRILDAGGGQGQIACQLAARGHQVILCDISEQMLARAAQHAAEQGVSARMELVQSPAQEMHHHLAAPVDLVLFHAVLEWVAEPQAVLAALEKCLAPGGALSLMFYNYNGLLMLNTLVGEYGVCEARHAEAQAALALTRSSVGSRTGLRLAGTAGIDHQWKNRGAGLPRLPA
ncbi:putative S-adenosyl-L-methionine-dependent methyltransferase [Edwardsiella tarda]|nr:putative S-adenosyl-L-methionine-dependent methyltransferase [Edwardsiella tarda]